MPKELEDRFQLTVSRDELTVIMLGLTAVAGLFNGDLHGAVMQMVAQSIQVRVRARKSFEPDLLSVLEQVSKLAHHYAENKKPHV